MRWIIPWSVITGRGGAIYLGIGSSLGYLIIDNAESIRAKAAPRVSTPLRAAFTPS